MKNAGAMGKSQEWSKDGLGGKPFSSAFRVVFDGITLKNGSTALVVIIVYTTRGGELASDVVDIPESQGGSGEAVADVVKTVLDRVLSLRDTPASFHASVGLGWLYEPARLIMQSLRAFHRSRFAGLGAS